MLPEYHVHLIRQEAAEISACKAEIPRAKNQLCYWHAITYIEERLAENKPPAAYDPRKAHQIFDFIDPTWARGITAVYFNADEEGEGETESGSSEPEMPVSFILIMSQAQAGTYLTSETLSNVYTSRVHLENRGFARPGLAEPSEDQGHCPVRILSQGLEGTNHRDVPHAPASASEQPAEQYG